MREGMHVHVCGTGRGGCRCRHPSTHPSTLSSIQPTPPPPFSPLATKQANGLQAYFASLLLFFLLQQYGPQYGIEVSWVYHNMGVLLSAMNVFSLAFCAFLLVKGLTRPSTTDSGSSGNWIIDFYW
jgi:7-dehydrocholesterol reductase